MDPKREPKRMDPMREGEICDELLIEILCRLGSCKYAIRCKCISKRWLSLIGDDYFIRRWLQIHAKEDEEDEEFPIDVVSQLSYSFKDDRIDLIRQQLPQILKPLIELLPLPVNNSKPNHVHILATYKDLLLCCPGRNDHSAYYLCNPYTSQWMALPPPPSLPPQLRDMYIEVGLIVDDHDEGESEGGYSKLKFKFKVVRFIPAPVFICAEGLARRVFLREVSDEVDKEVTRIEMPPLSEEEWRRECEQRNNMMKVEVYSSEEEGGGWRQMVIPEPRHFIYGRVSYKGMLVWLNTREGAMMASEFDPDNAHDYCHRLAATPIDTGFSATTSATATCRSVSQYNSLTGVCKGRLRFAHWVNDTLNIWELHSERPEWELVSRLELSEVEGFSGHEGVLGKMMILGFHPFNGDVVYLLFSMAGPVDELRWLKSNFKPTSILYLCNVKERRLKLIRRLWRLPETTVSHETLPLVLPSWPTPLPPHQHHLLAPHYFS